MNRSRQTDSGACLYGAECFTAAWTAGLLAAFHYSEKRVFPFILLGIAAAGFLIFRAVSCSRKQQILCICAVFLSCASWIGYNRMVRLPLLRLDGKTRTCDMKITDYRIFSGDVVRYRVKTKLDGIPTEADWYGAREMPLLHIGDHVSANVQLSRISDDFPYHSAKFAEGNGIYLRISDADDIKITQQGGFSIKRMLRDYRSRISNVIRGKMSADTSSLLLAMLFGDKNGMDGEVSAALYQTGIGHVTAVSGLHLVFFCTLLSLLLTKLGVSAKRRFFVNILAMLVFASIVDSAVSVYRAALMLLLSQSAGLFGRESDTLRSLCLAMLCCTLFTPYVIASASFWLSVSGVFGVGVLAPWMTAKIRLPRQNSRLYPAASVGRKLLALLCVSVAVFPASVIFCGESSLLSPICNLVLLPPAVAALYLGLLTACTGGLTAFLLPIAEILCKTVTFLAKAIAALPYSHLQCNRESVAVTLFFCAVFVLIIMALTRRRLPTICAAAVSALILTVQLSAERLVAYRQVRIASIGSEKYTSTVISYHGHTVVTDDAKRPRGAKLLSDYLKNNADTHIDAIICRGETVAAYNASDCSADTVCLESTAKLRENTLICGKSPALCDISETAFTVDDADFTVSAELLTVNWHGETFEIPHTILGANQEMILTADGKYCVSAIK